MKKYFQKKFRVTDPKTRKSVNTKALHEEQAKHRAVVKMLTIDIHDHLNYTPAYIKMRNRVTVRKAR